MPSPVPNLRDIGGLPAADGQALRRGVLLRSALPDADDATPDGMPWPPEVVLDLRSPMEIGDDHPLAPLGVKLINLPLLQALRPGWHHEATLTSLYELVLENAADLLVELVGEVASADGPVLVHCAAGKDRTGIAAALVLRLLGTDRPTVVTDYLRSRDALPAIHARLRRDEPYPPTPSPFLDVSEQAITVTLDTWDAHTGGAEGWFRSAGGTEGDLQELRARLLA